VWRPSWPCPVGELLSVLRRGAGDPTYRIVAGRHWRGIRTPAGAATLAIEPLRAGEIHAEAWGPGADWALESLPAMLGAADDPGGFRPLHPLVADAWRRHPHFRVIRTGLVMEALTPAVLEQRVTGQEAFAGFRMLVHRYGDRAPGPGPELRLWVQPDADTLCRVPSWEWLRMHVDPARSRALVGAARHARSLEATVDDPVLGDRRMRTLPGIGVWTSAEVRFRAHGDADAVSFGDYHVAQDVGWAVTGTPYDDDQLREFLDPWRPQRNRAVVLIHGLAGGRPRRGPRMAPRTHLPVR
jgi:3-methyladenine DNA glycosylase/8-oxoguanine DNA glycosylase